jgi:hypothetical protein
VTWVGIQDRNPQLVIGLVLAAVSVLAGAIGQDVHVQ